MPVIFHTPWSKVLRNPATGQIVTGAASASPCVYCPPPSDFQSWWPQTLYYNGWTLIQTSGDPDYGMWQDYGNDHAFVIYQPSGWSYGDDYGTNYQYCGNAPTTIPGVTA